MTLEQENERLSLALASRQEQRSEQSWMAGYRKGVGDAFDLLGERRDERMMVLIRAEERAKP